MSETIDMRPFDEARDRLFNMLRQMGAREFRHEVFHALAEELHAWEADADTRGVVGRAEARGAATALNNVARRLGMNLQRPGYPPEGQDGEG